MNNGEYVMNEEQSDVGKKLLSHIIERLTTQEVEVSDIKQILTVINKTMNELANVVETWDQDITAEKIEIQLESQLDNPILTAKTYLVKQIMTEYFKSNSKEAEDILSKIVYDKNVLVTEVAEA